MYHSITFGDKNTWDDWHIVPTSRPVFSPPTLKTKTLDIPGGDGVIDLTEALTGYPVYENRTGSFEFVVMNEFCQPVNSADKWYEIYSDIMDYLHGQKMIAVLEDDPIYYYEGRFTVSQWQSGSYYSVITIDYDVAPYKWTLYNSIGEWLSDPFDISENTTITDDFVSLTATTTYTAYTFSNELYGRAPVCPSFIVSSTAGKGISVRVVNEALSIDTTQLLEDGTTKVSEFIFYGDSVTVSIACSSGTGEVSIELRKGRL